MSEIQNKIISFVFIGVSALYCFWLWHRGGGRLLQLKNQDDPSPRNWLWLTIAGIGISLCVWTVLSIVRPTGVTRIPSPQAVVEQFFQMFASGSLLEHFSRSCFRIFIGFGLSGSIGVVIGWFAGTYVMANRLFLPTSSFIRYVPPTAFVTLLIVYFGIGEQYKYAVVFVSVFFFIIQMTVDAVDDIDSRYFEMGQLAGFPTISIVRNIVIPATMPRVVDILRINLSGAWTFLVAAEVVGADGGLGYLIAISQRFGRIEQLYVVICVFGVVGIFSDWAIRAFSARTFRWL